jgi:hypothetical protein
MIWESRGCRGFLPRSRRMGPVGYWPLAKTMQSLLETPRAVEASCRNDRVGISSRGGLASHPA